MQEHEHHWRRISPIPGTRSFHIECIICHKEALEIRTKVASLMEWGHIYKTLADLVQELEYDRTGHHESRE